MLFIKSTKIDILFILYIYYDLSKNKALLTQKEICSTMEKYADLQFPCKDHIPNFIPLSYCVHIYKYRRQIFD